MRERFVGDCRTGLKRSYTNARGRISGSQPAVANPFALAAGNTNPQGIADPPPPGSGLIAAPASIVSNFAFMQAPVVFLAVPSTDRLAPLQRVFEVTENVDEYMSQLASSMPLAPTKAQSVPLLPRTRFIEEQSIELALAEEEPNDSLHAIANELLESTLRYRNR